MNRLAVSKQIFLCCASRMNFPNSQTNLLLSAVSINVGKSRKKGRKNARLFSAVSKMILTTQYKVKNRISLTDLF
jgi:hypothetical protein